MVLRQLNLYYAGRREDSTCRRCQLDEETQTHIFWECPHAKECWLWLIIISHWIGAPASESEFPRFRNYCASRKAPPISTTMKMRLKLDTGSYTSQFEEVLQRIWRVLTTVCYTILWSRNKTAAKREQMLPETVEKGVLLSQCLDSFI
ncbi:RxLR effector candidate protein [Phytophthora palmivora]|uniref:RxLR effector candidate protein n=1 Tax=Phytophthora palmivora TaxID=4796 RepID=A0A2P4Y1Z0_9STRA|nr:RxLR effector candidate protein [Phytophthora palmivora]